MLRRSTQDPKFYHFKINKIHMVTSVSLFSALELSFSSVPGNTQRVGYGRKLDMNWKPSGEDRQVNIN